MTSFISYRLYTALIILLLIPNTSAVVAKDIIKLTNASSSMDFGTPAWSLDGTKIVYSAGSGYNYSSGLIYNYSIWVMNSDGTNPVQLTSKGIGFVDFNPKWSPDATRIVFQRREYKGEHHEGDFIYIMNADGSNQKKLISAVRNPSISPDGRYIAFDAGGLEGFPIIPEQGFGIYVMSIDGTNVKRLTNDFGDEVMPSWSPDGKKIVFTKKGIIYIMNADGSNMTSTGQGGYYATWSPDGKYIAFISDRAGDMFLGMKLNHIYIMDTDGTNVTQLTFGDNRWDKTVDWSPDGTKLVFTSEAPPTAPYTMDNIFIMALDFNVTITPTPTVTQIPTATPIVTPTQTPPVPSFSLLMAFASLLISVLIRRKKR